jgi:hypothetical protein
MTTLLPHHGQRKSTGGHRSSLKNTMAIRNGDRIHLRIGMIALVQTMVMMSKSVLSVLLVSYLAEELRLWVNLVARKTIELYQFFA